MNTNDNSDNPTGNLGRTYLKIRLKDAPVDCDSVIINLKEIRIKLAEDSTGADSGWITLATHAGFYDLLTLQNGVDTLISASSVPTDTLQQIRMILGDSNRVVVNGVSYALTIPSGAESGLKINLGRLLNPTLDSLTIDFDAAASVHATGNDRYMLRPVLRVQ